MQSIDHLPEEEKIHFMQCDCGEFLDMRNLSEVFAHQHACLPEPEWSHSVLKGDPAAYSPQGRRVALN